MGENRDAYQVVVFQAAITMAGATLIYFIGSPPQALAVWWGGFASVANGVLLAYRISGGRRAGHLEARRHLRFMYRSTLERFFVVIGLLVLGMGWLKLVPLAVLVGFVAGQVTLVIVRLLLSR